MDDLLADGVRHRERLVLPVVGESRRVAERVGRRLQAELPVVSKVRHLPIWVGARSDVVVPVVGAVGRPAQRRGRLRHPVLPVIRGGGITPERIQLPDLALAAVEIVSGLATLRVLLHGAPQRVEILPFLGRVPLRKLLNDFAGGVIDVGGHELVVVVAQLREAMLAVVGEAIGFSLRVAGRG